VPGLRRKACEPAPDLFRGRNPHPPDRAFGSFRVPPGLGRALSSRRDPPAHRAFPSTPQNRALHAKRRVDVPVRLVCTSGRKNGFWAEMGLSPIHCHRLSPSRQGGDLRAIRRQHSPAFGGTRREAPKSDTQPLPVSFCATSSFLRHSGAKQHSLPHGCPAGMEAKPEANFTNFKRLAVG